MVMPIDYKEPSKFDLIWYSYQYGEEDFHVQFKKVWL